MSVFASRYARAFADAVSAAKLNPSEVDRQLSDFAFAWHESPDLREVLDNPAFPSEEKVVILDKLNERIGVSGLVRNFLAVLINHDRLQALDDVVAEYRAEMDRRQGIFDVDVVTARSLDDAERKQLEAHIAQVAGGRVTAKYREDSTLLGGVIVTLGSTVYDGSVRGRLERLKEELVAG